MKRVAWLLPAILLMGCGGKEAFVPSLEGPVGGGNTGQTLDFVIGADDGRIGNPGDMITFQSSIQDAGSTVDSRNQATRLPVTLSHTGLPSNFGLSFSANPVQRTSGNVPFTFTVTIPANTPDATYDIVITGNDGERVRTFTFSLNVVNQQNEA